MGPAPWASPGSVPLCSLPATHREVGHSVVVRLEHPGVLEDVIPEGVKPVQRDQELGAGDPLLEKGTGTASASVPGLLHWEILLPGPQKVGVVLGRRGQESGGLGQSWGRTTC